jgi:hypothetical protein
MVRCKGLGSRKSPRAHLPPGNLLTRGRVVLTAGTWRADVLNRVSRSFAIVIQQLGPELRDAVRACER